MEMPVCLLCSRPCGLPAVSPGLVNSFAQYFFLTQRTAGGLGEFAELEQRARRAAPGFQPASLNGARRVKQMRPSGQNVMRFLC